MSPSESDSPPSSPSCFAHEADDIYMGYASQAEIMAFLEEIRASTPATAAARDQTVHRIRQLLPRVRDGALYRELADLALHLESGKIA
jgi:hypothetical protein